MKTLFAFMLCLVLTPMLKADVVLTLTSNTADELSGTFCFEESDLSASGFIDIETAGGVTFLFDNFPGAASDQGLTIIDFPAASLEQLVAGGGANQEATTATTTMISGTYTSGFNGGSMDGEVNFQLSHDYSATKHVATFSFTAVPEPSSFLLIGVILTLVSGKHWLKTRRLLMR